jgi:hypothetical protein
MYFIFLQYENLFLNKNVSTYGATKRAKKLSNHLEMPLLQSIKNNQLIRKQIQPQLYKLKMLIVFYI